MVNTRSLARDISDDSWRQRGRPKEMSEAAFEKMLAPDSSVNKRRAEARARAREAAAAAARGGRGSLVGVTNPKEKDT